MKKVKKGEYGYLDYKKKLNLLIMAAAFAVVFIIFFAGLIVTKTRNNYCTVAATVLVLPAAKFAVSYFILLPHKSADKALAEKVTSTASNLTCCFDCIFSNKKSPIGTLAVVVTDNTICAYTKEEKADVTLFETSVRDFLKNEKLNVTVTLYKEEKAFIKRVAGLSANFDKTNETFCDRMEWNTAAIKNMCL